MLMSPCWNVKCAEHSIQLLTSELKLIRTVTLFFVSRISDQTVLCVAGSDLLRSGDFKAQLKTSWTYMQLVAHNLRPYGFECAQECTECACGCAFSCLYRVSDGDSLFTFLDSAFLRLHRGLHTQWVLYYKPSSFSIWGSWDQLHFHFNGAYCSYG